MPKKVPLNDGHFAIVDDEDYEVLSRFKWHVVKDDKGKYLYAITKIRMHRFVLNVPSGMFVDHINGDTLDNRKSNLRICTNAENQQNTKSRGGSSRYKGVSYQRKTGKWMAAFIANKVHYYCGLFNNEEDAALAVDKKRAEVMGHFASRNIEND